MAAKGRDDQSLQLRYVSVFNVQRSLVAMLIGMKVWVVLNWLVNRPTSFSHTENNVAIAIQKYVDNSANDHPLILTPLYHAMGFFLMSANLARGNTNVLIQRYTEEAVFDAIQKYKVRCIRNVTVNIPDPGILCSAVCLPALHSIPFGKQIRS